MSAQAPIRSGFVETEGGLRLYWRAAGVGPTLICCNGVGVSTFFWRYVVDAFSDRFRVVVWDYRGHGRSESPNHPDAADLSIAACARDLGRVQDIVAADKAVLIGHSMGCQVLLERAIQAPDRVAGLVPMLGSAGRVLDTFYDNPNSAKVFRLMYGASELLGDRVNAFVRPLMKTPLAWEVARLAKLVDPYYMTKDDFGPYLDHMGEIDMRLFLRMVAKAHEHDAFPHLPEIEVPALIVAAENDGFTPLWLSQKMVRELPDADLLVLADGSHAALMEQPHTINHRLERFLVEKVWPRPSP